jgi:hypothetical protein
MNAGSQLRPDSISTTFRPGYSGRPDGGIEGGYEVRSSPSIARLTTCSFQ